jgi:threonine dehydratase
MIPVTVTLVHQASERLLPYLRQTPALYSEELKASLKLEYLQHAGSFKTRGAFHHLLTRDVGASGVTAASGGNHGAAVAYAAKRLGHSARIFVPRISSPAKVNKIKEHGADVVIGGDRYQDAQDACNQYAKESGALLIHPFDSWETLVATGTVAKEWEDQAGPLDTVLVACGGGGLVAGMALYWKGRTKVIAIEPAGSCALYAALQAGHPIDVSVESLAADSLGARRTGEIVFAAAKDTGLEVRLVSDEAIVSAQHRLWSEYRIASEPGGAAALGALLSGVYVPTPGERVGVLLCGANVELQALAENLTRYTMGAVSV